MNHVFHFHRPPSDNPTPLITSRRPPRPYQPPSTDPPQTSLETSVAVARWRSGSTHYRPTRAYTPWTTTGGRRAGRCGTTACPTSERPSWSSGPSRPRRGPRTTSAATSVHSVLPHPGPSRVPSRPEPTDVGCKSPRSWAREPWDISVQSADRGDSSSASAKVRK